MKTIQINLPTSQILLNELQKSKELYNAINFLMRQKYLKLQDKSIHPERMKTSTSLQFPVFNLKC